MSATLIRWPVIGGLFALYLWPRYFFVNLGGKGVSGFTAAAMALLLLAVVQLAMQTPVRRAFGQSFRAAPELLIVFVFWWIWRLVADLAGDTPGASLALSINMFLYLGAWFFVGAILLNDVRLRGVVLYVIAACGLIATAAGMLEFATGTPLSNALGFSAYQAGDSYQLANLSENLSRGGAARIRSLFSHPLVYGQMLAAMTPVAMFFILQGRGSHRLLGMLLAAGIVTSITLCNARSPYFVAAASAVVYFAVYHLDPKNIKRLMLLFWGVIGFALVAPVATGALMEMVDGRTADESTSSGGRDRQMRMGLAALSSSPVTGYGSGSALEYAAIIGRNNTRTVDNYYLTAAVETGYVGAFFWVMLLGTFTISGMRIAMASRDDQTRGLACVCLSSIVGLSIGLIILSIMDTIAIIFLMGGCLMSIAGYNRTLTAARRSVRGSSRPSLSKAGPSSTESFSQIISRNNAAER